MIRDVEEKYSEVPKGQSVKQTERGRPDSSRIRVLVTSVDNYIHSTQVNRFIWMTYNRDSVVKDFLLVMKYRF